MIIVTGGAGFIGSCLVKELEVRGARDIVVCDLLGTDDKWKNIAKRELADLIPPDELPAFLNDNAVDIETVFHMGAVSNTTECDADLIVRSNIRLSIYLWDWCAANDTNLVYASSAATYGDGNQGFEGADTINGLAKLRPMNAYGWSKHAFDRRIARIVSENGPRPPHWAGLKFFNVYGPNEYHKGGMISVALKNFREIEKTGKAVLFRSHNPDYPDGGQQRDEFRSTRGVSIDSGMVLLDGDGRLHGERPLPSVPPAEVAGQHQHALVMGRTRQLRLPLDVDDAPMAARARGCRDAQWSPETGAAGVDHGEPIDLSPRGPGGGDVQGAPGEGPVEVAPVGPVPLLSCFECASDVAVRHERPGRDVVRFAHHIGQGPHRQTDLPR